MGRRLQENESLHDILLVEDNPGDARLAAEALKESGFPSRLHWVADGVRALEVLRRRGPEPAALRPGLILLDLNLPRMDGREVLEAIKRDPELRRIPVVVLTTSRAPEDRERSYDLHANCYINKPTRWEEFTAVVRAIQEFWLGPVALPESGRPAFPEAAAPPHDLAPAPAGPGTSQGPQRVLLVEDDPDDARHLREILGSTGRPSLEVLGARSIDQALSVLREERVDAILLDPTLPDGQDLEGLSELRGRVTGVPVVVLAESRDEDFAARCLRWGAQDCLVKGLVDGRGLARAVQNAIERNKPERMLEYMARHDVLTELPNRALLEDRLGRALEQARRNNKILAVLFLDLDRFKRVNDSFGHVAADRLLQAIAARLSASVRASDTVARQGGDEFTILLPEVARAQDIPLVAEKILECLRPPFLIDGCPVTITASLGASCYPDDGSDAETLLKSADEAMYSAKRNGRGVFEAHPSPTAPRGERESMALALRRALQRGELALHYQPAVNALGGSIVSLEALVRWRHPTGGLISARRFLPLAEETGLIIDIGEWVLRQVSLRARDWQGAGLLPLRVVVNVSYRQLNQGRAFQDTVVNVLRETGLDPQRLELDVVEESLLRDESTAVRTLRALHDLGIRISLDQFGSGPASLIRLRGFPFASVKIAPRFIHHVTVNPDDAALVSGMIAMAHSLRMGVLAQGVANAEQVAFLLRHQIDMMQGYYFSRPLPEDACARLIEPGGLPRPADGVSRGRRRGRRGAAS